jgi:hypothetical protein
MMVSGNSSLKLDALEQMLKEPDYLEESADWHREQIAICRNQFNDARQ